MLKWCNDIERSRLGASSSGTCCEFVASIGMDVSLGARWISSSVRTEGVCCRYRSRSWSLGAAVSKERRGRRTLAVALSRHMVGRI